MSVKITGLNLLNSNIYDRILITERNSDYKVYIKKNKGKNGNVTGLKFIPTEYRFSDELKGKTDEEKIIMITKKFLEYARINKLSKDYLAYNKIYDVASGTREFRMRLFNPNLNVISQMIMNKYLDDRLKFIYENENINAMNIHLTGSSSYTKDSAGYHISLELFYQNGELAEFEKEFLTDLIYTKLDSIGGDARIEPICYINPIFMHKESTMDYALKCGELRIVLGKDRNLLKQVQEIIDSYYKNLHKQKIMHMNMQIKMEGF